MIELILVMTGTTTCSGPEDDLGLDKHQRKGVFFVIPFVCGPWHTWCLSAPAIVPTCFSCSRWLADIVCQRCVAAVWRLGAVVRPRNGHGAAGLRLGVGLCCWLADQLAGLAAVVVRCVADTSRRPIVWRRRAAVVAVGGSTSDNIAALAPMVWGLWQR